MAIQNDNTILNKGDLKAYHERIAPMLGGTFMVSTNNSDYYSTDEKVVGVWTDGKPVYQKTISTSWSSMTSDAPYQRHLDLSDPIDTPISISAILYLNGKAFVENGSMVSNNSLSHSTGVALNTIVGTPQIYWSVGNSITDRPGNLIATIQYTKTTDTASTTLTTPGAYDINFPNTWPANKEIFFGNGVYGYRATGNVASDKNNVLPISGVKKFYGYGGSSDNGAGANVHTFPYTNPANLPTWGNCLWADHNNGIPHIYWGTGYTTNTTFDIWFKYTK